MVASNNQLQMVAGYGCLGLRRGQLVVPQHPQVLQQIRQSQLQQCADSKAMVYVGGALTAAAMQGPGVVH
jgi:hypothetical protein